MATEAIPLLRLIRGQKLDHEAETGRQPAYRVSILTTFNAYLPFYEEVILRQFIRAGCREHFLIMDSEQLRTEMAKPHTRPLRAGRDYTLLPVKAPRAFHPKIGMMIGSEGARVFIGSHNATLSGFGINREVTNIAITRKGEPDERAIAQSAWQFVSAWLLHSEGALPADLIRTALAAVERIAPWLTGTPRKGTVHFIGSTPAGAPLWESLPPMPHNVTRVIATSAFFDPQFAFLRRVQDDLTPDEMIVGIEPSTVSLNPKARLPEGVRFVDAGGLADRNGYLHAKCLYVEGDAGDGCLVTGSPNLSSPAWLADPRARNAEAAVVRVGDDAREAARDLRLTELGSRPSLGMETWNSIHARIESEEKDEDDQKGPISGIAVVQADGVAVHLPGFLESSPDHALAVGRQRAEAQRLSDIAPSDTGYFISVDPSELSDCHALELKAGETVVANALIHDPAATARHGRSKIQQGFLDALDSLPTDTPDLVHLVAFAEKLVYESPEITAGAAAKRIGGKRGKSESAEDDEIGTLIIEARPAGPRRVRRHPRAHDVEYLLDLLLHGLGRSEALIRSTAPGQTRSEEEEIGLDEDTSDPHLNTTEAEKKRKELEAVRRKLDRLYKRLSTLLSARGEKARAPADLCLRALGVLSTMRLLRQLDPELLEKGYPGSFIPLEKRRSVFTEVMDHLFERKTDLFVRARDTVSDDVQGELSMLLGLLLWLARDAEFDVRNQVVRPRVTFAKPDTDAYDQAMLDKSRLLTLAPLVAEDHDAASAARESVELLSTLSPATAVPAKAWLDHHLAWGAKVAGLAKDRESWDLLPADAGPEFMAIATRERRTRLRIVHESRNGNAHLYDHGVPGERSTKREVIYPAKDVIAVETPS